MSLLFEVLVDTCIWSLVLRRSSNSLNNSLARELTQLIQEERIIMLGTIRQEILSGIRHRQHFEWLREELRTVSDFSLTTEDYETAAEFYNLCRAKGVQGSHTDFLLCAVSHRYNFPIFTTDKDFQYFQKHIDFQLYSI